MSEKFEGRYQVADGYVGGARPQYVRITADDIDDLAGDATDTEIVDLYEAIVLEDFERRIFPNAERVDEFIAWARQQIAARTE